MIFGTHYYVLLLNAQRTVLYEAFRDALIRVENHGFPVTPPIPSLTIGESEARHALMRTVDECFDFYDSRAPLGLLVVGDEDLQSAFDAVTTHGSSVVGRVKGDRSGARATDLGQIAWPVVKEVISAVRNRALSDLDACSRDGCVASGLEAVAGAATARAKGTLLVEDDFHVRGHLAVAAQPPTISKHVDVRDIQDDAVDAVIELVLEGGGNVVFMDNGALTDQGRIALLFREPVEPRAVEPSAAVT